MKIVLLICFLAVSGFAADSAKQSAFQFRLITVGLTDDSEKIVVFRAYKQSINQVSYQAPTNEMKRFEFYVKKTPLMDTTSIKAVELLKEVGPDNFGIVITFTEEGKLQFADMIHQHVGEDWATFIDGKMYDATRNDKPFEKTFSISLGKAVIIHNLPKSEATNLAAKINRALVG